MLIVDAQIHLWNAGKPTSPSHRQIAMMAANFLPKIAEVAQRHPNLRLILDHLGRPRGGTSPTERWANLADVLALAKYPNVAMKATGAPSYSDQPYPFRDIHDNP